MDKIITKIPKLKNRQMKAYDYELTKNLNDDNISLPIEMNYDTSNILNNNNDSKRIMESEKLNCANTKDDKSVKKDVININKPLLIENYAEVLIQKLLTQKLRHLKSNDANLSYYYHGSI